ncbi:MAG: isochorismatase family protein [Elusimicrobia bacterium]|nr:isochorismatase family protein [Elusimicrobiota bacterium]
MKIVERRDAPRLATLYLAELGDENRLAEFVDTREPGVPKRRKWVMMISTQVGCAIGCRMCDAGAMGFHGNLTAEEMLAQVRHVVGQNPGLDAARHPKLKIHFARMGEPSLNPAVLEALELLAREFPYPGILPSLSTVAPKSPAVDAFFSELLRLKDANFSGGRFQLQFSLHAAQENRRREIVPVRQWTLDEIAAYGERFVRPGDRKITLNFALSKDSRLETAALTDVFNPAKFLVKMTPVNPTRSANLSGAAFVWNEPPPFVAAAARELGERGFDVIVSPSLPEEIRTETSCGQLWSTTLKERARRRLRAEALEETAYVTPRTLSEKAGAWRRRLEGSRRRIPPSPRGREALLVVDMQDFFLSRGSPAYLPQARAVLGNVRRLVEAFREAGRPVFFTVHAHEDPERDGGLMTRWWRKVCLTGTPWARTAGVLTAREGEVYFKRRYSAFTNPQLHDALRESGAQSLVVAGVLTNLCVESTVRDAFDLGWPVSVVGDATAAHTEELHLASLGSMAHGFAHVPMTRELLEGLAARPGRQALPSRTSRAMRRSLVQIPSIPCARK